MSEIVKVGDVMKDIIVEFAGYNREVLEAVEKGSLEAWIHLGYSRTKEGFRLEGELCVCMPLAMPVIARDKKCNAAMLDVCRTKAVYKMADRVREVFETEMLPVPIFRCWVDENRKMKGLLTEKLTPVLFKDLLEGGGEVWEPFYCTAFRELRDRCKANREARKKAREKA